MLDVYVHAISMQTRGVWRHAPPGNFLKVDALRLLLRPLWDMGGVARNARHRLQT